ATADFEEAFSRFKALADKKKHIFDEDLIALVDDGMVRSHDSIFVKALKVATGLGVEPSAELTLMVDGEERRTTAVGDGAVDAIFRAIGELYPHSASLAQFQIHAVTAGTDAQATVTVRLEEDGRTVTGRGADTDTLVAAAHAYVNALNKLLVKRQKQVPEALSPATTASA
ncbi:MAG: alpha-isopropylmalate synthase regulatory domain-containing protein, partial [Rhizomicrobium sp.]